MTAFGRYELRRLIGRGGMGEVYEAFDTEQQRVIALKVLPASLAADPGFVERFRRESFVTAQLTDPHVIPIHRYGEIDGRLYIDMRMVHGQDLSELLQKAGALPADRAVNLVSQAAQALDAAHASNLIHRDVKPSNLLITGQDFVYLVDFGIAHSHGDGTGQQALTATGATIGTLDYMAPERFANPGAIDARTDVYSLACVLFECLTGRRPYPVSGLPALMHAHLTLPPPRVTDVFPALPVALDAVIARGMAKDPAYRYRSPGELARDAAEAVRRAGPAVPPAPTELNQAGPAGTLLNHPEAPPTVSAQSVGSQFPPVDPGPPRSRTAIGVTVAVVLIAAAVAGGFLINSAVTSGTTAGSGTAVSGSVSASAGGSVSAGGSASGAGSASSGQVPSGAGQQAASTVPATAVAPPVPQVELPIASGDFGDKPTLTYPSSGPVPSLQRVILSEGSGPLTQAGDWLITNYLGQVWGGEVFDNSYDRGSTLAFQIGVGRVIPGWDVALVGVPVGSRVLLSLPPADGYGTAGNANAGIAGTDTLVFVVDIVQAFSADAGGQTDATPQPPPANAPVVTGALGVSPTVTIPAGTPEPTAPVVTVLARGTGAPIELGQILAQYTAVAWTGELAASSWPAGGGAGPEEIQVTADSHFAGLVGVPLGSRVLVQVPRMTDPSTGQPLAASAGLVDVLAQLSETG